MKFILASILAAAASAAAPPASIAEENRGLTIITPSENLGDGFHLFHLKKEEDVDESTRKLRGSRELGSKKKTSAPTEAPQFFFDVLDTNGNPYGLVWDISGDFVKNAPSDCIGTTCQGGIMGSTMGSIISGAFDGCGNGAVTIGYACTGSDIFALACPGPDITAFVKQPLPTGLTMTFFGPSVTFTCTDAIGEVEFECVGLQTGTDCH